MLCRTMVVLGVLLATGFAVQAQTKSQPATPALVLEDQFQKTHDIRDHRGDVVVLIYGDRKSADANKALGQWLHITFHPTAKGQPPAKARQAPVLAVPGTAAGVRQPDVLAIPVACVGQVPSLVRSILRSQFRSASPDVPVWLDFTDQVKTLFGFQAGVPNVVVLDTLGRYRYSTTGAATATSIRQLAAIIEALRQEAVRPPTR